MSDYTYSDPAGGTLTIEGDFKERLVLWQSQFTVTSQLSGRLPDSFSTRSFSVTHAQNHDEWLEDAKATLVGEYSLSGGSLQIWRPADQRNQGLARWVGEFHAAMAYLPFQQWKNHDFILGYFGDLQFKDSPSGLTAAPARSSLTVSVLDVTALIEGMGLLEIRPPSVGLGSVPAWAGHRVSAGEIWKVSDAENPDVTDHLLISSGTAVATVMPHDGVSFDSCLSFLSEIARLDYKGAAK